MVPSQKMVLTLNLDSQEPFFAPAVELFLWPKLFGPHKQNKSIINKKVKREGKAWF